MPVLMKVSKNKHQVAPSHFWGKVQLPIFVIDDTLTNLFKWIVLNTKEINRFHLLISSDSFFLINGSLTTSGV